MGDDPRSLGIEGDANTSPLRRQPGAQESTQVQGLSNMITRYRNLAITHSEPHETVCDLAPVEALLSGGSLPDDFAEFLIVAHGGLLFYESVVSRAEGQVVIPFHMIRELGPELSEKSPMTLVSWTKISRELGAPKTFLQFGFHPFLADFYFDVPPSGSGAVYCDVDDEFIRAAKSFQEYLESLRVNHDAVLAWLQTAKEENNRRALENLIKWMDVAVPDWRARYSVKEELLREHDVC